MTVTWQEQQFDSEIFGVPTAWLALSEDSDTSRLASEIEATVSQWVERGIWLAACRIEATRIREAQTLEDSGFKKIETLLTFCRPTTPVPVTDAAIALARADDFDACIEIGRTAFIYDRYHADPRIESSAANLLKAAWVRNGLAGYSDAAIIAKDRSQPAGFILCTCSNDKAMIDLIAVSKAYQNRGFGRKLVAGALAHYAQRASEMCVSTQSNNTSSLNLYRGIGFSEVKRSWTFHWMNQEIRPSLD